jgi:hypothetical protein
MYKPCKVAQPYPGTLQNTQVRKVIPERNLGAPHGNINKYKCYHDSGEEKKQIKFQVIPGMKPFT